MLFNSIEFALFLPIVFVLYWFVTYRNLKLQNALIVAASFLFYGWWDWRFLFLLLFSSLMDFGIGLWLKRLDIPSDIKAHRKRKVLLAITMIVNLGFLGFFKYYNFFVDSFLQAFTFFGMKPEIHTLKIILPVGISFYTFQTMSYTIDVYRRKLEPTSDLMAFMAFVSFFPQLVAGPIERATNLLPQFFSKRTFTYEQGSAGMRLILYGLFKKMVIADNCAILTNDIFKNYQEQPAAVLIMGAVYFALQIYGDFSGYSDIARGTAKLFGLELMVNFRVPYFSRDMAEFWRRWHISLTTWFRDYLYIPLGGSRVNTALAIRNTFIVFLVSGFWHGANWTFLTWGAINALFFVPLLLTGNNRKHLDVVAQNRLLPNVKELFQMGGVFAIACFAWIFFRAETMTQAIDYITHILTAQHLFTNFFFFPPKMVFLIPLFFMLEWFVYRFDDANERMLKWPLVVRHAFYLGLIILTIIFTPNVAQSFIYFQF
ncbi:MAG: MBOAT family O-acyltransferase [Breznakibacter sp.]